MKLLLTVCVTCTLLYTGASLRCHVCDDEACANSTSVTCPLNRTVCQTVSTVRQSDLTTRVAVNKRCSSLLSCVTPLGLQIDWSVNRGFDREAQSQICCIFDNCNSQSLPAPSNLTNGKQCPACGSSADSMAGTCNASLSCVGIEDRCFSGTTTSNTSQVSQLGCISGNLCGIPAAIEAILGSNTMITCEAPWSFTTSTVLLTLGLSTYKVLV